MQAPASPHHWQPTNSRQLSVSKYHLNYCSDPLSLFHQRLLPSTTTLMVVSPSFSKTVAVLQCITLWTTTERCDSNSLRSRSHADPPLAYASVLKSTARNFSRLCNSVKDRGHRFVRYHVFMQATYLRTIHQSSSVFNCILYRCNHRFCVSCGPNKPKPLSSRPCGRSREVFAMLC